MKNTKKILWKISKFLMDTFENHSHNIFAYTFVKEQSKHFFIF